jgi:hypothetical protein
MSSAEATKLSPSRNYRHFNSVLEEEELVVAFINWIAIAHAINSSGSSGNYEK